MCDANDQEELKKYTRRDFATWAASAGVLTALPSVANAVAVVEREVSITTPDGICGAYFVSPSSGAAPGVLAWGVGEAVDVPATGLPVAAGALPALPGFGTGLTNSACQTYRTRNARKIARRTRRSTLCRSS